MKRRLFLLGLLLLLAFPPAPVQCQEPEQTKDQAWNPRFLKPINIQALNVGKLKEIATISSKDTRGFLPVVLSWSSDDSTLFIISQKIDQQFKSNFLLGTEYWTEKPGPFRTFYSVPISGEEIKKVEEVPQWVSQYWNYKSYDVSVGGTKIEKVITGKMETVYRVSGVIIGRPWKVKGSSLGGGAFSASAFLFPGFTYSWSSPGGNAIAFLDEYKFYIMSEDGKTKRKIASGDLVLPAWSNLGNRIAFISVTPGMAWIIQVVEMSGIEWK